MISEPKSPRRSILRAGCVFLSAAWLLAWSIQRGDAWDEAERPAQQPDELVATVIMQRDGVITDVYAKSGAEVEKGQILYKARDFELEGELESLKAEIRVAEMGLSFAEETGGVQLAHKMRLRVAILRQRKAAISGFVEALTLRSPMDGFFVNPNDNRILGRTAPAGHVMAFVTKERKDAENLQVMSDN